MSAEPYATEISDGTPKGREEIRAAVLDAADELFASRRPSLVSIREIAARAGVNHALVHRHFDTKESLVREAIARADVRLARGWEQLRDATDVAEFILRNQERYGQALLMLEGSVMDGDTAGASSLLIDGLSERLTTQGFTETEAETAAITAVSLLLGWATYGRWLSAAAQLTNAHGESISGVSVALRQILQTRH